MLKVIIIQLNLTFDKNPGNGIPHRFYCLNVSDLAKASPLCACLPAFPSFVGFELSFLALLESECSAQSMTSLVGGFVARLAG